MTQAQAGSWTAAREAPTVDRKPPQTEARKPFLVGRRGLQFTSMDEMYRFAEAIAQSDVAPTGSKGAPLKTQTIFVMLEYGMELGLEAMQALQNIMVVNGRPALYGDGLLAICRGSGIFDENAFSEEFMGKAFDDDFAAVCTVSRMGSKRAVTRRFSVSDAKRASLWGKAGPWTQYPWRMLQMRARGFALRDTFADCLKGIRMVEEVRDIDALLEPLDTSGLDAPATGMAGLGQLIAKPQAEPEKAEAPAAPEPEAPPISPEEESERKLILTSIAKRIKPFGEKKTAELIQRLGVAELTELDGWSLDQLRDAKGIVEEVAV